MQSDLGTGSEPDNESSPSRLASFFINANLFRLWAGQAVSQAGDIIYEMALIWLVLDLTGSKQLTGLVALSVYLPAFLFGAFAGAFADHFPRRGIMLFSDAARFGLVLLVPILHINGLLSIAALGIISFAVASLNSFFNPARDAIIPQLVDQGALFRANALVQTTWQFALLLGPAAAGLLLLAIDVVDLFYFDALTFLISFFFIRALSIAAPPRQFRRSTGLIKQTLSKTIEGLNYVSKDKILVLLLLVTALDNFFIMGPALVGEPIFIKDVLNGHVEDFALVKIAYAIGLLASTALLSQLQINVSHIRLLLIGMILDGLTFLPLLWVTTLPGMLITITIHAMAIPLIIIPRSTLVHRRVSHGMQGRVFSLIGIAVVGMTAISTAVTGVVAEFVPIASIFAGIGIAAAACGLIGLLIISSASWQGRTGPN